MLVDLKELYTSSLRSSLFKELGCASSYQVPNLTKIVLNIGIKESKKDSKTLAASVDCLSKISGQKAVATLAKKSIAGFKIREKMTIGAKVTLRGKNMFDFLSRLVNVALPTVRDFRGLNVKFDKNGNYNLGIKDWMIFPELDYDSTSIVMGLNISFCIKNGSEEGSFALLKGFGMPLKNLKDKS